MRDDILNQYETLQPLYEQYTGALRSDLERALEHERLKIQLITKRTKEIDSLTLKLDRKGCKYESLGDITDLAGVRAVFLFDSQIPYVAQLIRKQFVVDELNSPDHSAKKVDVFGYRSVHFVVTGTTDKNGEIDQPEYRGLRGEIQIRSLLSHAWAELTNDLEYKSVDSMSEGAKRQINRIAALLELCDREFVEARLQKGDEAKWREAIRPTSLQCEPLSLESFSRFVSESNIVTQLDLALAKKNNSTMHHGGPIENLRPLLEELDAAGYKDTGSLEGALWDRRSEILNEYEIRNSDWSRYLLAFPDSPGVTSAPRGFCLYYLLMLLGRR